MCSSATIGCEMSSICAWKGSSRLMSKASPESSICSTSAPPVVMPPELSAIAGGTGSSSNSAAACKQWHAGVLSAPLMHTGVSVCCSYVHMYAISTVHFGGSYNAASLWCNLVITLPAAVGFMRSLCAKCWAHACLRTQVAPGIGASLAKQQAHQTNKQARQ